MQRVFARIHQHPLPVSNPLALWGLVGLAAIVEGYRVRPDILDALPRLLQVVLPVHGMPVEVDPDPVLEARPWHHARVGRGSIDYDCPSRWTPAVADPVIA